jgi:glycosyltransferase involved in cell wall biosynthesis
MNIERIAVCEAQVPFVTGGAEAHAGEIVRELRDRGYRVERVAIPFKWYPKEEILAHAAAWRLIDLSESNGRPIDLVIATKFPSYFVRHPNKVTWLVHQYRAAYDLCGTPYGDFDHTEQDVALRDRLMRLDRDMLGESVRLFTIARNTASRLERFNGLRAELLYHPPRLASRLRPGPFGNYVLFVGRLEPLKRLDLVLGALGASNPAIRLVVAGDGPLRADLERTAQETGVRDRVEFCGWVGDDDLIDLYAGALATVYPPFDEDYGYVTLESFLARKPVITTSDAGGPLEFVDHEVNGAVCEPTPGALAAAMDRLAADPRRAEALGDAGFARASAITWDGVIEKLLGLTHG